MVSPVKRRNPSLKNRTHILLLLLLVIPLGGPSWAAAMEAATGAAAASSHTEAEEHEEGTMVTTQDTDESAAPRDTNTTAMFQDATGDAHVLVDDDDNTIDYYYDKNLDEMDHASTINPIGNDLQADEIVNSIPSNDDDDHHHQQQQQLENPHQQTRDQQQEPDLQHAVYTEPANHNLHDDDEYHHEDIIIDDRTWLDILGEVAKEYLTNQVIPPTDETCVWDWRVARCEPYCECDLTFTWGDYHLGRACRLRQPTSTSDGTQQQSVDETGLPPQCRTDQQDDPMTIMDSQRQSMVQDSKWPKRVLFHIIHGIQTTRDQSQKLAGRVQEAIQRQSDQLRDTVCTDMADKPVQTNHNNNGGDCILKRDLTWRERMLCQQPSSSLGHTYDMEDAWAICPDDDDDEAEHDLPNIPSLLTPPKLLSFSLSSMDDWTAGVDTNAKPRRQRVSQSPKSSASTTSTTAGNRRGFGGTTVRPTTTATGQLGTAAATTNHDETTPPLPPQQQEEEEEHEEFVEEIPNDNNSDNGPLETPPAVEEDLRADAPQPQEQSSAPQEGQRPAHPQAHDEGFAHEPLPDSEDQFE